MTKKEVEKKKTISKKNVKPKKNKEVERILIENFVGLQRVMTKLSERFDHLSGKISELLELFEESAKVLVKKEIELGKSDKYKEELLNKVEKLLEQNKIIAKGLTLIHENNSNQEPELELPPAIPEPLPQKIFPRRPQFIPPQRQPNLQRPPQIPRENSQEYERSPTVDEDSEKPKINSGGLIKPRVQEKEQTNETPVFEMPQ